MGISLVDRYFQSSLLDRCERIGGCLKRLCEIVENVEVVRASPVLTRKSEVEFDGGQVLCTQRYEAC
jgi:hypothetical protein